MGSIADSKITMPSTSKILSEMEQPDGKHCCAAPEDALIGTESCTQPAGAGTCIAVAITLISGEVFTLEVPASASVTSVKALIQERLGHASETQQLLFAASKLSDAAGTTLEALGVHDGSTLTLVISCEPLGQHSFEQLHGKKEAVHQQGSPAEVLSDIELQSWLAAWQADEAGGQDWSNCCDEDHPWGNTGWGGVDFYWTTRDDGCRYEYWSTAPGDNEYGFLVRVNATSVRVIGKGSDDGLEILKEVTQELRQSEVVMQLLKEGWPRFHCDDDEDDTESEDEDNGESDEE